MKNRWITALIGIPIVVIIWMISSRWYEIPTFILIFIVGLILNYEFFSLVKDKKGVSYPFFLMSIFVTLSTLSSYLFGMKIIDFTFLIVIQGILFLLFFYYIVGREIFKAHNFSQNIEHLGFYFIAYITIVICYPQFIIIKFLQVNSWGILLLFGFCWLSDAFGLFTGMAFGKHKLTMLPSKSKTIEGYIGSLVGTILCGILFYYLQGILSFPFQWSLTKWGVFGLMISISSNFGDLTESLIKRWADKKDSSNLLPGMGGFFDAIDSQIYSIPIALIFFSF